jgi:hypothetical protein
MGGRANLLQDAAAIVGIGDTSTSQVEGAQTCLVTSGEGVPTRAVVPGAA